VNTLRILLVDDHQAVRRGLRSLLSSRTDWQICAEAADGLEALERARSLRPNVVLMDISMPLMNGLEATRVIRKELPEIQVVIISQNDPSVAHRQAEDVGAAGFVSKSSLAQELPAMLDRMAGAGAAMKDIPRANGSPRVSATPVWLTGGGTMGQLIRKYDWSRTPLGQLESWPQSLKTSVNLMVNSRHPMWIGWGRDITFLYNDAYIDVLSLAKHPAALGMPAAQVWAEIWDICGPLADKVFQEGEASFLDDVRLFMNRGTFLEETYYSFSYSPIRDESGKVTGLFCPSTEVTPKVINARRLRTLAELSANALTQRTINSACSSAAATLAKNPDDIPFAALYVIDAERKEARLAESYGFPVHQDDLLPRAVDLSGRNRSGTPWPIAEVAISQQGQVAPLRGLAGLPHGLADQNISESMVLPVTSRGETHPLGVLIAGVNPTRRLDAEYRTFYELVASQIATGIQNSRAIEDERRRTEALAEIDRAKTAFFSNVSHEFRTPLTLMLGPVEELLARSHTELSPSAKNQLELVNRNGSRLLRLVNTLLDFSRIEAGRMQATYQPTDLSAFTKELAGVFRSATEKAGLELELDCPPLAEPVYVDRNLWEKIVLNLMSNAFKFTFDGKISVQLKPNGKDVELRVSDTGVGIPAQELPRLFDRFHRVENSRSRTHEGSGIGLALVQELARLHGGTVRVESTLGEGSTFTVSIPMGTAHLAPERIERERSISSTSLGANPFVEEALRWLPDDAHENLDEQSPHGEFVPAPRPPQVQESASGRRPFIVVADDNADMRQYLVRLLSERYEVVAVPDGRAALEVIRTRAPELVLTDVMMPRLDGFALLGELRADPGTRTIPIIVLSARAGEESRVEGLQHGADDYLVKPFSARELLARVQTHLELARVRRESAEALSQRTAQFETLLNEAPLGVYLVGSDFRIREINPQARTTFGDIPNLIGRDFDEVIHILWPSSYANEIVRQFRHTLESGEPYFVAEHAEKRLDLGVPEIYEWQINRILLPEGHFGVVCYFREISHQVRTREGLRENENRLRKLSETLDAEVRERTRELEARNADVLRQSQQVRTLSRRLLQAQDDERRRVARELHDSAGQTMAVLAMNLSQLVSHTANAAPHLARQATLTQELVQQLNQEIRTASYLLHPPLLDETGLTAAVSWYIEGLRERSGLNIQFSIPKSFARLPQEIELVIFRVLQECLTNIHRHSGSKTAAIRIARDMDTVSIEVEDQGKGMSPERLAQIQSQGSGVGIRGMRERVRQFEGSVNIESSTSGTRILVTIPVPPVQETTSRLEEPQAAD
jgi:signal transduction histidine kinase